MIYHIDGKNYKELILVKVRKRKDAKRHIIGKGTIEECDELYQRLKKKESKYYIYTYHWKLIKDYQQNQEEQK